NSIKRAILSPFDRIQALLQCVFPMKRRSASSERARFLGETAQKPCTPTKLIGRVILGFQCLQLCSVRIIISG
ncbi:MAG: hypothetical protein SOY13_00005, partial [Pseudoflavonifractor sp.]|nr:hypothetical protein [Pseudoflavonifractor sp.]